MPTPRFTPEELRELHDFAARWAQIVSKRAFGDDGPGLDAAFRTFEQIVTAAAPGLTEGTPQLLLQQHADELPTGNPVNTAASRVSPSRTPDRSPLKEPRSNRSNASPTAPIVAGIVSPLRTALRLDEHGFSSFVIERIATSAARFNNGTSTTAKRRAFVADGAAHNWSIHESHFRDFEPVVDLEPVRTAARPPSAAGRTHAAESPARRLRRRRSPQCPLRS